MEEFAGCLKGVMRQCIYWWLSSNRHRQTDDGYTFDDRLHQQERMDGRMKEILLTSQSIKNAYELLDSKNIHGKKHVDYFFSYCSKSFFMFQIFMHEFSNRPKERHHLETSELWFNNNQIGIDRCVGI